MSERLALEELDLGVPGLDILLNRGITKYSFVVITGLPGSGKTTLAHQIMFNLANTQRKALYFTIVGEPPLKMLRFQQQYAYFDIQKVGVSIKYFNLADSLQQGGFEGVLERILKEVEDFLPELIFVDSFKSVVHASEEGSAGIAALQSFVQRLGMHLASWQATTFLIGEYPNADQEDNPIFTVADGVIHLTQEANQNAIIRKIRILKMRGKHHITGLHTFRITDNGLQVFPRLLTGGLVDAGNLPDVTDEAHLRRLSTGSSQLDEMLHGGIPVGYSVLVVGPPGSGKTVLATAFLAEGARVGEPGIITSFEFILSSSPNALLNSLIREGTVTVVRPLSLDLSIEEVVTQLMEAVNRKQAKRVVIDSLSALELVLAPQFRENFEESLFRMIGAFAKRGITVLMIRNTQSHSLGGHHHPAEGSYLVDGVITLRHAEINNRLVKLISSDKLRASSHSDEIRAYTVSDTGINFTNN